MGSTTISVEVETERPLVEPTLRGTFERAHAGPLDTIATALLKLAGRFDRWSALRCECAIPQACSLHECGSCNGNGEVIAADWHYDLEHGDFVEEDCAKCGGAGEVWPGHCATRDCLICSHRRDGVDSRPGLWRLLAFGGPRRCKECGGDGWLSYCEDCEAEPTVECPSCHGSGALDVHEGDVCHPLADTVGVGLWGAELRMCGECADFSRSDAGRRELRRLEALQALEAGQRYLWLQGVSFNGADGG